MQILFVILRILGALVSAIGGILVFFGALGEEYLLIIGGTFLIFVTAAFDVFSVKYEDPRKLAKLSSDLFEVAGSQFAFPVLLLFLYISSNDRYTLLLCLAMTIMAFFKVLSTTIKAYIFDTWQTNNS